MIRDVAPADVSAVVALAVAAELFTAEESGVVETLLVDYFGREHAAGHACALDVDDSEPVAVAYWQPAPATDRTWYLTMLGVRADRHRQGRGSALLRHVEEELRMAGQRLLLVETSATPAFDRARSFYRACAYREEARVRDYYEPGDDLVVFSKELSGSRAGGCGP